MKIPRRQFHALLLAIFCMGAGTGWICGGTTAVVRAWQATAEAAWAERSYYNKQADEMIAEAQIKIKEKKHATAK